MHLDQDAPLALKESDRLQALLEELENRKRCKEELGRQLGAECQRLNLFLEQSGVKQQGGLPQRCSSLPDVHTFLTFIIRLTQKSLLCAALQ